MKSLVACSLLLLLPSCGSDKADSSKESQNLAMTKTLKKSAQPIAKTPPPCNELASPGDIAETCGGLVVEFADVPLMGKGYRCEKKGQAGGDSMHSIQVSILNYDDLEMNVSLKERTKNKPGLKQIHVGGVVAGWSVSISETWIGDNPGTFGCSEESLAALRDSIHTKLH